MLSLGTDCGPANQPLPLHAASCESGDTPNQPAQHCFSTPTHLQLQVYRKRMKAASTSPSTPCRVMSFSRASRMSVEGRDVGK